MPWLDTEKKLLALLTNAASPDGEWQNAAAKLRAMLLRRQATVDELTGAGNGCQPLTGLSKADWGTFQMPWGTRRGEMLADIDLRYLMKIRDWLRNLKDINRRNVHLLEALNNYLKC